MIYIVTGLPGAGKTLFAIEFVQREFAARAVYYAGIADLKMPWIELEGGGKDWSSVPDGAVIVIDEAQFTFRPRGTGAAVPKHVSDLEQHRHRGIDLVLITQHPKLIDANVRRLSGFHAHLVRAFGAEASVVHQWSEVCDDPDKSRADSIRKNWIFPKAIFTQYKSAEAHTHKLRLPWKLFAAIGLPIVAVLCMALGIAYAYRTVAEKGKAPETVKSVAPQAGHRGPDQGRGAGNNRQVPWSEYKAAYLESIKPVLPGFPHTAQAYAEATRVRQAPEPAGCVASSSRCLCYTQQATALPELPEEACRQIVASGYFRAWAEPERGRQNPPLLPSKQTVEPAPMSIPGDDAPKSASADRTVGPSEGIARRQGVPASSAVVPAARMGATRAAGAGRT